MSLARIPIEIITDIFDLFDESNVEMPLKIGEHRKMCKILMALRLTCKTLEGVATRQLFRTFYISQSRRSWLNAHSFAANQELRQYLQTLVFFDSHDDDVASYWQKYNDAKKSLKLRFLGFSQFPNLKVFKLDDTWMLRKNARSSVEIPLGRCGIRLTRRGAMIPGFDEMARYDFRLVSISHSLWLPTKSLDLSSLKSLRLSFYPVWWFQVRLDNDLDNLKDLPNLEEFHMNQFFPRRCDDNPNLHSMTNVLEVIASGSNWPRLRHLDLRYLFAEVDQLKSFVALHAAAGTLKRLEIHGDLICAHVTPEEEQKRVDLPHWINTVICAPNGGVETFKHVTGPPEEWYEAKFSLSHTQICMNTDMEDMDTEDTDMENPDADDPGTNGPDTENSNTEHSNTEHLNTEDPETRGHN